MGKDTKKKRSKGGVKGRRLIRNVDSKEGRKKEKGEEGVLCNEEGVKVVEEEGNI